MVTANPSRSLGEAIENDRRMIGRAGSIHGVKLEGPWPADQVGRLADEGEQRLLDGVARPAPPASLGADAEEYVAAWRNGDHGALLSIAHDPDDDEEPYALEITAFVRMADGWRWRAGGGSDWPVAYGGRAPIDFPALTGFALGLTNTHWLRAGVAPREVEAVCMDVDGVTVRAEVDSVTGAFLVALPYDLGDPQIRPCD